MLQNYPIWSNLCVQKMRWGEGTTSKHGGCEFETPRPALPRVLAHLQIPQIASVPKPPNLEPETRNQKSETRK